MMVLREIAGLSVLGLGHLLAMGSRTCLRIARLFVSSASREDRHEHTP